MMPKRCQNNAKATPDRPKNGPKSPQSDPFLTHFHPILANLTSIRLQKGRKTVKKGQTVTKKQTAVQTASRPSSKCITTLNIHPGCIRAHPLTAHFYRLKRRFWPSFKQNKCLQAKKGLFLPNFAHFW